VAKELACCGIGDDAPVAMTGSSRRLDDVRARAEHPAATIRGSGDGRPDRCAFAAEDGVPGDQRPVEVDRECGDACREGLRELDYGGVPPVALTT
jgi:hypothetical protein